MTPSPRELLGDLLVASVELAETACDPQRWLVLASALATTTGELDAGLLAELLATLSEHDLVTHVRRPFEDAWPRIAWERACMMRSGFEALRDLFETHAPHLVPAADMSRIEQRMIQYGEGLFVPLPVPIGTPRHHWWWRAATPPAERTMMMNARMRDLWPPRGLYADNAPAKFRALTADGFADAYGMLFFCDRVPGRGPTPRGRDETQIEAETNIVQFAEVFEPDPSRRPVDTAATAIACARHLAYELRRHHPPSRIIVVLDPSLNEIRFHKIRPHQDWVTKERLDGYTSAMLVLDSDVAAR